MNATIICIKTVIITNLELVMIKHYDDKDDDDVFNDADGGD